MIPLVTLLLMSCEEKPEMKDYPMLATLTAIEVDSTGATFRGELINEGMAPTTSYGFVWSTEDPNINTSEKVVLGTTLPGGIFKARIDSAFYKGFNYQMKAFATYGGVTVYGNSVEVISKGCQNSVWTLVLTKEEISQNKDPYGCSNDVNGYILYQDRKFFVYETDKNQFINSYKYPFDSDKDAAFTAVGLNKILYVFSNLDDNLFKFDKGKWAFQAITPFSYTSFTGYSYAYAKADDILLLNSTQSHIYHVPTNTWDTLSGFPQEYGTAFAGGTDLNGKAYLMTTDKIVCQYDPEKNEWAKITAFPGVLNDKIVSYAYGNKLYFGLSSHRYLESQPTDQSFWSYDLTTRTWAETINIPVTFASGSIYYFIMKGSLYIGYTNPEGAKFNLYKFDPNKAS